MGYPKGLTSKELSEFFIQLKAMTGAGIPLSRVFLIMGEGAEKTRLFRVCKKLERYVYEGQMLSGAMEETGVFPELAIRMIQAAEASGRLKETAALLALYYQKDYQMKLRVQNAMVYPKILLAVCMSMILIVFLFIMPALNPLLADMDLPAITKFLMLFSRFLAEKWYFAIMASAVPFVLWKAFVRHEKGRYLWDKWKIRIPGVRKQLKLIYAARFSRILSSLYSGGIPMIESLRITGQTLGNRYLERKMEDILEEIRRGGRLSHGIGKISGFDRRLSSVIFVGEETGRLDEMLETIAESYEYESEEALLRLTELLHPVLILVMGVVICVVLLAVMVPIWRMYENIG